jgi:hypothetical protein
MYRFTYDTVLRSVIVFVEQFRLLLLVLSLYQYGIAAIRCKYITVRRDSQSRLGLESGTSRKQFNCAAVGANLFDGQGIRRVCLVKTSELALSLMVDRMQSMVAKERLHRETGSNKICHVQTECAAAVCTRSSPLTRPFCDTPNQMYRFGLRTPRCVFACLESCNVGMPEG